VPPRQPSVTWPQHSCRLLGLDGDTNTGI
jgi:hypothetical protein